MKTIKIAIISFCFTLIVLLSSRLLRAQDHISEQRETGSNPSMLERAKGFFSFKPEEPVKYEKLLPSVYVDSFRLPEEVLRDGFEKFKDAVTVDLQAMGKEYLLKLYTCHSEAKKKLKEKMEADPNLKLKGLGITIEGERCLYSYVDENEMNQSAYTAIAKLSGDKFLSSDFGEIKLPHKKLNEGDGLFFGIKESSMLSNFLKSKLKEKTQGAREKAVDLLEAANNKVPFNFKWDSSDYIISSDGNVSVKGVITHGGESRLDVIDGAQALVVPFKFVESPESAGAEVNSELLKKGRGEVAFYLEDGQLIVSTRKGKPTPWYKSAVGVTDFGPWSKASKK